ncbi:hypothetical protein [Ruminococcus flavefaciens]|uniref:Uncharacterized protein n=1 Tax=Ruminococcus flavefaciens 007c TaxID=1341157 RepID=W7UI83_RUMFL|nr:hypothetical protein [Ruminococcus flavefaciens]EWM54946.1 hypothetical protein RF007C_11445 [Ruminococcus flavefaciens 007c]
MQRRDYQDALNELRLRSSFCEEMEKKLKASSVSDEYTDEVTHVEVVPQRSFKKTAVAVAAALVICGVGGGAVYRFGGDIKKEFSNEEDETIGEGYNYDYYAFNFPFGRVELHGTMFNYIPSGLHSYNSTTVSNEEEGRKLFELFSNTNFEKLIVVDDDTLTNLYQCEGITFEYDGGRVTFYDNGIVSAMEMREVFFESTEGSEGGEVPDDNDITVYYSGNGSVVRYGSDEKIENYESGCEYYRISVTAYRKMRDIIFGINSIGSVDVFGIVTEFSGAEFSTPENSGTITNGQATYIADMLRMYKPVKTEMKAPSADREHIDISMDCIDDKYKLEIYPNGFTRVTSYDDSGNEIVNHFKIESDVYSYLKDVLRDGKKCDVPFDTLDGNCIVTTLEMHELKNNAYLFSDSEKEKLEKMLIDMDWRECMYGGLYSIDIMTSPIYIITDNVDITLYSDGKVVCDIIDQNGNDNLSTYKVGTDDFVKLKEFVSEQNDNQASSDVIADIMVKRWLSADKIQVAYNKYRDGTIKTNYHLSDKVKELTDALISCDWEVGDSFWVMEGGYYEVCSNSTPESMYITRDGSISVVNLGMLSFKCSTPEKYLPLLDEIFKDDEDYQKFIGKKK